MTYQPATWMYHPDEGWRRFAFKSHLTFADMQRYAELAMKSGVPAYAEGDEAGELSAKAGVSPAYAETELNK